MSDETKPGDPAPTTLDTIRVTVADGIHWLEEAVRPGEELAVKIAKDAWHEAAKWAADYAERNKAELSDKIAKAVVAYLLSLAPGVAPEANVIAGFVVSEAEQLFEVLVKELTAQGVKPAA